MLKRKREGEDVRQALVPPSKRSRSLGRNHFLDLSNELILRILSFLPVHEVVKSEQICRRLQKLASDNEIWKEKFYVRFVRPRARKIPTISALSQHEKDNHALYYASKSARWLEHNTSSTNNCRSDWKRRYKVKLNWTRGKCKVMDVALDCPCQPRTIVKICQGNIYTADERKLRLYSQRSRPQILCTHYWANGQRPTAMAVDLRIEGIYVTIGFLDGSFQLLKQKPGGTFEQILEHKFKNMGAITSLTTTWPYILTMTTNHQLNLLEVVEHPLHEQPSLVILTNLRSDTHLLPVSLSLRKTSNILIASIAYAFNRLNAGWCLGLQEIRLGLSGGVLDSRLTSTVDTPMKDFPLRKGATSSRSTSTAPFALHPNLMNPPTSLSHSGCYILAGLPDNTLMVYTIISNDDRLEISAGRRLFGHTSAVSGAEVSDRGKALSISAKGDEIRVWELEELLSSWSLQNSSTRLRPQYSPDDLNVALAKRGAGLGLALEDIKDEFAWSCHWVGFDDEQVVVLGEKAKRSVLSCYDFA